MRILQLLDRRPLSKSLSRSDTSDTVAGISGRALGAIPEWLPALEFIPSLVVMSRAWEVVGERFCVELDNGWFTAGFDCTDLQASSAIATFYVKQ